MQLLTQPYYFGYYRCCKKYSDFSEVVTAIVAALSDYFGANCASAVFITRDF